nr:hypothetical protein [Tanacetum cinerariifolium]
MNRRGPQDFNHCILSNLRKSSSTSNFLDYLSSIIRGYNDQSQVNEGYTVLDESYNSDGLIPGLHSRHSRSNCSSQAVKRNVLRLFRLYFHVQRALSILRNLLVTVYRVILYHVPKCLEIHTLRAHPEVAKYDVIKLLSQYLMQWEVPSGSGNFLTSSGNALCILFPTVANLSNQTLEPSRHLNFIYDDDDDYEESTILLNEIDSQIYAPIVITTSPLILRIEDPEDSLIMGNEELDIIPKKESDKIIKPSVEDFVPIPSESEDISGSDSECDFPSCDDFSPINVPEGKSVTFSNPFFDSNDDFTSSDDESLSDEDVSEDNVKIYVGRDTYPNPTKRLPLWQSKALSMAQRTRKGNGGLGFYLVATKEMEGQDED